MGSEKKSILHALKEKELDEVSLQNYMTYQFVPEPDSLTKNVKRLEPGHQFTKKLANQWKLLLIGKLLLHQ